MDGLIDAIESKFFDFLGKASPLLHAVFDSPFASIGLSLIGRAFNVNDGINISNVAKAVLSDTEAQIKLKALENEHFETLAKLAAKNYETEVSDRKSARWREVSLRDYVPTILAIGFLINYAAIQFYCVTHPSTELDVISARFQDVLIMIMSYYFGSSHKTFNPGSK